MSRNGAMLVETDTSIVQVTAGEMVGPVFNAAAMRAALAQYRDLQAALDEQMPESIMALDGKPFRKKSYWRAVATAFALEVECFKETRIETASDWGYTVTYRAKARNGRIADGDGACFAQEKSRGRMKASEHNVRSHAHTRAFNRAVSNLVGFGEVSAEEVDAHQETEAAPRPTGPIPVESPAGSSGEVRRVAEITVGWQSEDKAKTLWIIKFDNQVSGSTFNIETKNLAEWAMTQERDVVPTLVKSAKYKNRYDLMELVAVREPGEESPF